MVSSVTAAKWSNKIFRAATSSGSPLTCRQHIEELDKDDPKQPDTEQHD
jgi:hypothetical protein